MHTPQGSELSIQLESDSIILHGTMDESSGATLRGTVVLHITEVTKIKSVYIRFQGKNKVSWYEGFGSAQRHYAEDRKIIENTWHIMEPKRKPYYFTAGTFKWDFELPIPGDLPSTLCHELGEVTYQLKAVAERPTFSANYLTRRNITVTRLMLPSSLELNQSVVVSNEWPNKIFYNISIPRMIFSPGSQVPIHFDLIPIADGLSIVAIDCIFEEFVALSSHHHTLSEGYLVKAISDTKFPSDSSSSPQQWTRTEIFPIPEYYDGHHIQIDVTSDLITISHKLKITVSLKNSDGHTSELRATIPIIIASVAPEEEANELPAYEDAWKTLPYDPITIANSVAAGHLPISLAFATPCPAASQVRPCCSETSSTVSDDGELDEPAGWQGADLTLVPSYTTAVRSNRLYSFSGPSLPTYDSIAIAGTAN
ncbi:hypothetical protein BX666DRAFT_1892369 [Dichotomocladium elegans]|nr:hypothetical protein BX666DRAFT_1892369 [Dichotomocladium elegans]